MTPAPIRTTPTGTTPASTAPISRERQTNDRIQSNDNQRATFTRLLRDKQGAAEQACNKDKDQAPDDANQTPLVPTTQMNHQSTASPLPTKAGTVSHESATVQRMNAQAYLGDQAMQSTALPSAPDNKTAWHATLPNAFGADLQLRATRESAAQAGASNWSLAIGSPDMAAATLARHSGRLTERLAERLPGRTVRVAVNSPGQPEDTMPARSAHDSGELEDGHAN